MMPSDLVRRLDDLLGLGPVQEAVERDDPLPLARRKQGLPPGVKLGLRAAVSIGLLLWVISGINLAAAAEVMRRADLLLAPVVVALFMGERLLGSLRWYLLVRGDSRVTYWRLTRLLFATTFAGFFLPGSVGVELLRVYSLGRGIGNLARAFSSVLIERIQALTALAVLTLVGLLSAPPGMPPEIGEAAWLGLVGMLGATLLLMWPRFRQLTLGLLPGARLDGLRDQLAKVYGCLDLYRRQPGPMALGLLIAFGFQILRVLQVVVGAWALGLHTPLQCFFAIMPTIILLTLLPISIAAGLGVREAAFVYLFGLAGMPGDAAFGLALFVYVISFSAWLPGGWIYARSGLKLA
jgi:glycosyltransferase 2 family protein